MVEIGLTQFLVLLGTLIFAESQNLIKNTKEQKSGGRLIISEVNADNPGLDTTEFVELFHTSRQNVSLDGYTLVFYNGKTNMAYKVLNLTGLSTDNRGFFLIGSLMVNPRPSIIVPSNTIQNGPDAIALYFGDGTYRENMKVTNKSLEDALVHKAKPTEQADVLQNILTPGIEAFLEDASFHSADESIGRCMEMDGQWTFRMTHVSPASENYCKGYPAVVINEVSSPYAQDLYVEIRGPPSAHLSDLVLAFIRGEDQELYHTADISGHTNKMGFYLLENENASNRAQQTLPESVRLFRKGGGAVALYLGKKSGNLLNTRFPTSGLVDAVVYGDYEDMGPHPLQDLTMGDPIIYWHSGDVNISASRCNATTGGPAFFMLRGNSPGQTNDCPSENKPRNFSICFRVPDCSLPRGDLITLMLLHGLVDSLQVLSPGSLPADIFTDPSFTCQSGVITLHVKQNSSITLRDGDLSNVLEQFVTSGTTIAVGVNATVLPSCQASYATTLLPDVSTTSPPDSKSPAVIISEINPNTPGAAEDTEFVELHNPLNFSVSLAGYWLVFYNGKNNLAYYTLDLKGYRIDKRGYFLVGSAKVSPKPNVAMPYNTLQNGADAVALYYRPGKGYKKNMEVTADGLVDAVVYVSQVGDDAERLLKDLTPGQEAVHENERFHEDDESLSRCNGLVPLSLSSFQVTRITPLADNDCTTIRPSLHPQMTSSSVVTSGTPVSLMISEVGVLTGSEPYNFIELKGRPGTRVHGITLVLYDMDGKVYDRFGLEGFLGLNGFYVISLNATSEQRLPSLSRPSTFSPEALALYTGSPESFPVGSGLTQRGLLDAVVYSWESSSSSELLRDLGQESITLYGEQRLFSVSRCPHILDFHNPLLLPVPQPSPGSANLCPFSSSPFQLDLCIKDSNTNCSGWEQVKQQTLDGLKVTLSASIEQDCSCFSPPAYIQDLKVRCAKSRLSISGEALTFHKDQHLIQTWNTNLLNQPFTLHDRSFGSLTGCSAQGTFKAWHVAVLVLLTLLLIFGAVALLVYLRKRRPQNYTSIEMNAHRELISEY
ncbi:glycerol-3-phosphate dehydrogenase [Pelobates cultripes]|uniref:Glycerol-3-phosphate dehydrogenase n=2 Tax=Pelobates cultripes TaxID=61616 RepID=A0AAD1SSY8_PELCU|nr:glycerol-3-phosphate dehydrogenase [Pelobates cultripes]